MSISEFMNFARIFHMIKSDRNGKYEKFLTNHQQTHLKLPENPEDTANLFTLKKLENWRNSGYFRKLTLDEKYMIKYNMRATSMNRVCLSIIDVYEYFIIYELCTHFSNEKF